MKTTEKSGTVLYHFNNLSAFRGIFHYVSTRKGGCSRNSFSGLNLGFHVGDDNFNVLQNRRLLSMATGLDLMWLTFANQDHTANIAIIDRKSRGKGAADLESALENTDGMVTNVPRICLNVLVADCVPVLLFDPIQRVIAALHAGWRGTLKRIAEHAVEIMIQQYGSKAENIVAALGPCNGSCCYEVGEDVRRETLQALGTTKGIILESATPGKYIFDQWNANKMQLLEYGVKEKNIEVSGLCTHCNNNLFYSVRAAKGNTGRFAAGIMLCK